MPAPAEVFTLALARASKRGSRHLRRMQSADRDDILAMALAWCWEHRDAYPLDVSLDAWFEGVVRNCKRAFFRRESKHAHESLSELEASADDPDIHAQATQALESMAQQMTPQEAIAGTMAANGASWSEIRKELGVSDGTLANIRKSIRRFRALAPVSGVAARVLRDSASRQRVADAADAVDDPAARIDKEIAQLDFPPPVGAPECPPCWRCKYFEGYLPGDHLSVRLKIAEPEVRDSVARTEARKIQIAQGVRSGGLRALSTT